MFGLVLFTLDTLPFWILRKQFIKLHCFANDANHNQRDRHVF